MSEPRPNENYSLRGLRYLVQDQEARRVTIVTFSASLCLIFCYYLSVSDVRFWLFRLYSENITVFQGPDNLHAKVYWGLNVFLWYFIAPALIIKLVLRQPLSDYGFARTGVLNGLKTYGLLFAVMLPLIIYFSYNAHFQETYPFYRLNSNSDVLSFKRLLVWEVVYAMQFLAVEFFFRGFLLHGLKKTAGFLAISAMVLPYCMIHFGKPMPEAIGSIVAGYVLGYLSLRSNNIFPGMLLHISVAYSMDILSLWHKGLL